MKKAIFAILAAALLLASGSPRVSAQVQNDDHNPVGVTGAFEGVIQTGCGYNVLNHSTSRAIDDIVVPGSIGKYPLKMTRYYTSRRYGANGLGPGWSYEYLWQLSLAGFKVTSPQGDVHDFSCGRPVGTSEGWDDGIQGQHQNGGIWRLADGGKVNFESNYLATYIEDPYGQRTTIEYTNGYPTKVTESGGRYLKLIWGDSQLYTMGLLLTRVEAHGLGNATVTDWVNYTYTAKPTGGTTYTQMKVLTSVTYSDNTSVTYAYEADNAPDQPNQNSYKMYPLVATCNDVRYKGPMRRIAYDYQSPGPHGAITAERYSPNDGAKGVAVSSISPGLPSPISQPVLMHMPADFTETRGDGPARAFHYTDLAIQRPTECCDRCPDLTGPAPTQFLESYTDFQNHTTQLGYDGNWYVNSVTDANNHTTTYTRGPGPPNGIGQITRITHPDGTHVDYTYYNEGTGHIGGHYIYTVIDERGGVTTYTRDANYRVTRIDYPSNQYTPASYETFTYNNFGQVLIHRLKNDAYESFAYDTRGLLTDKWNPKQNAIPSGNDPHTHYDYYTSGPWTDRVLKMTLPANVSGYQASETYEYDRNASDTAVAGRGLVTKITHADNTYQSFGYDAYGNKLWEENELRQRTSYTYDEYNRVLTVTNPLYQTETFSYLKPGTSSSYLHTTNSVYTHTSRTGIVTSNIYDQNFRKTSVTQASGTSLAATTTFGYDAVGNLTRVTDPLSRVTLNGYDARNRKTATTEAYGTNVQRTTVRHYDGASNIYQIDRPDGTSETKGYDALNRVVWDTVPQTSTINLTTWFGYNPSGTIQWVKDANLQVTTFEYDAADQKTKMTYPGGSYQSWSYDAAHNLANRTTVGGKVQQFGYDNRNRKVAVTWGANANVPAWDWFNYDATSRLTTAENGVGAWGQGIISIVTRSYDAAGRLLWEAQNVAGLGVKYVEYAHDSDGKETRLLVRSENYDYTFSYDAMGRFEKICLTIPVWQYTYDPASNETARLNLYNGVTQIYTRDALNRMSRRDIKKGATTYSYEVYGYDAMSRLSSIAREDGKTDSFTYYKDGELNTAQYDTTRSVNYALDKAGNRTSMTDNVNGNATYTPNALNQYTAVTGSTISNGPEHEISAYQNVTYTYINDEHLTRASDGTNTYDLKYDALGRCVKRTLNGVTTYYVYDGEKPILEYGSTGGLAGWNVYGKGIDEIIERGYGQTLPANWQLVAVADFNGDGHPDYALYNTSTFQTAIWYLNNNVFVGSAYGPTLPANWQLVAVADFNGDGHPDYALYNPSTFQTAIWYLNNNVLVSSAYGPTLPANWQLVAVADFNGDGHPDYALYNTSTFQTAIWYLNNNVFVSGAYGPTLPANWQLVAVADFNGDGHPDYALYNTSPFQTAIWYLNNNVLVGSGDGAGNAWHWYFLQQDHEGSVTHLTDTSGAVIEKYRYDAFGAPTIYAPNGTVRAATIYDNRFLFTGREYAATYRGTYVSTFSFYEYRARAYHPTLGRFMSEDPKLFDAGDYNLFRYCHNDPIDSTDPMGTQDERQEPWPNHQEQAKALSATEALWQRQMNFSSSFGAISHGLSQILGGVRPSWANSRKDLTPLDFKNTKTVQGTVVAAAPIEEAPAFVAGLGRLISRMFRASEEATTSSALSTMRFTQPGETFYRYESGNPAFSRVTSSGGVTPGTFAAPVRDGQVPIHLRGSTYNLPSPNIARPVVITLRPSPGTAVIGPRSVVGGPGNEVIFPFGY